MKTIAFLTLLSTPLLFVSCASKKSSNDYDVTNPYAAPDYSRANSTPAPQQLSNVNPAYDAPAVYEEATTTPTITPINPQPRVTAPKVPKAPINRPALTSASTHTVVPGDSLWKISKKYGVSIDEIKQANAMTKDTVVLGTALNIPVK